MKNIHNFYDLLFYEEVRLHKCYIRLYSCFNMYNYNASD